MSADQTPDTGEVDAGTTTTRRQVGVDIIDGLSVEAGAEHGLVGDAREADQRHPHRCPSITHGSARRFAPPRMELVATNPARAVLPEAICRTAFSNQ